MSRARPSACSTLPTIRYWPRKRRLLIKTFAMPSGCNFLIRGGNQRDSGVRAHHSSFLLSVLSVLRRGPGRFDEASVPHQRQSNPTALLGTGWIYCTCSGPLKTARMGCMWPVAWKGECHYLTGNFKAKRKVNYVKEVLAALGIGAGAGGDVQHEFLRRAPVSPRWPGISPKPYAPWAPAR